MELYYDLAPYPYFSLQRKLGIVPFSIKRNKVQPRTEFRSIVDPLLCVPASSMKFSGFGTTPPHDCPPGQLKHLRDIASLLHVNSVEVQSNQCGWSLSCSTHQALRDGTGLQLFRSTVRPLYKSRNLLQLLLHRVFSRLFCRKKKKGKSRGVHPGFKVLIRNPKGSTVITMICLQATPENDEMEIFLGKYTLSVGKVRTVASAVFAVWDEKGDLIFYINVLTSYTDSSILLTTYQVFHVQLKKKIGLIKCCRRKWAKFVPKCCLGHRPGVVTFDRLLPLSHKALLLGSLFFIAERTKWRAERIGDNSNITDSVPVDSERI